MLDELKCLPYTQARFMRYEYAYSTHCHLVQQHKLNGKSRYYLRSLAIKH